jgi:predicted dehydrogenase
VPPLRVGLVGAGWVADDHVSILGRIEDAELVAVCDLDRARAEGLAPPGARVYADWRLLLDREELDALWVCTPPLAHREPAVAALERGLPLYLEKPVARTLDDARAIVDSAARSGTVCAVGYQWHGTEVLDDLRSAVAGQEIALVLGRSVGPTHARPWFLDRAQGGGNILERASHQVDLLRAIGGEILAVQAAGSAVRLGQGDGDRGDIEDAAALVLRYESGAMGAVAVAWTREGQPSTYAVDVLASEATLRLTLDPEFTVRGVSAGRTVDVRSAQHPWERTVRRFLEAARDGRPESVFCTPADAARTLAVAVAAERALASGATEAVDAI